MSGQGEVGLFGRHLCGGGSNVTVLLGMAGWKDVYFVGWFLWFCHLEVCTVCMCLMMTCMQALLGSNVMCNQYLNADGGEPDAASPLCCSQNHMPRLHNDYAVYTSPKAGIHNS